MACNHTSIQPLALDEAPSRPVRRLRGACFGPLPVRRSRPVFRAILVPLVLSVVVGGCAVTRVEPPAAPQAPSSFKEAGVWQKAAGVSAQAVPDAWWTLFGDPVLDDLEKRLLVGNENLKAVVAQVASARATVDASRSAIFPTVSANVAGTRGANPDGKVTNSVSLGASANWELDLWGRLSQALSGARAGYQASADDLASARLSAQATLAQTYFSMRAAEVQQSLLERTVAAYEKSLALTQARYDGGVAARSDVLQAQSQLSGAKGQALEAATQRAQLEHAIAVLLGQPPSSLNLARTDTLPAPPAAPELLPGTLLERRPDIAAAERRVAAAYAQIGVADAAYFPNLSLSADAGYRAASLSRLVSAPNLFWSVGASVAESILDGGQRQLASAQARASADQAVAAYRQAVLAAYQEVEDNLVLAHSLADEATLQDDALQAARRALEIVLDQYKAGTVSYLNVVVAQASALSAESSLISIRTRQLTALNQLLKNVAGRWEAV